MLPFMHSCSVTFKCFQFICVVCMSVFMRTVSWGKKNDSFNILTIVFFLCNDNPLQFPPLPAKAQLNTSAKMVKQLGLYFDWRVSYPFCALTPTWSHPMFHSSFQKDRPRERSLLLSLPSIAGLLATGDNWKPYCRALEAYLQQVAAHPTLNKNRDLETFLTSSEVRAAVRTMTNTAL